MSPTPTTAAYLRVSSEKQAGSNGTDAQRHAIRGWAMSQGIHPDSGLVWYDELAVSGKTMKRPQWQAMMERVRAGEVRTVVIYDLTRAGRTLKGLCEWVEEMVDLGVRVVFVKDSLDISTALGRLIVQIMGAVAEFERHAIKERVRAGIRASIASGKSWGRGRSKGATSADTWRALAADVAAGRTTVARRAAELGVSTNYAYTRLRGLRKGA